MGVETFLIAYAINIIIAQRLVRRLCEYCKRPMQKLDPIFAQSLGFSEEETKKTVFYEAVGCNKCHNGYKGRAAIHETLFFSKEVRKLIFETGSDINEEALKELMAKQGMATLRDAARERVKQGLTTLNEVAAVTSED
jgi:type IV pilus assembly protein PilB